MIIYDLNHVDKIRRDIKNGKHSCSQLLSQINKLRAELEAAAVDKRDYLDTLVQVLNVIGYTKEFASAHPDLKVSEGVRLFLSQQKESK